MCCARAQDKYNSKGDPALCCVASKLCASPDEQYKGVIVFQCY